jgi:hypothetical protein
LVAEAIALSPSPSVELDESMASRTPNARLQRSHSPQHPDEAKQNRMELQYLGGEVLSAHNHVISSKARQPRANDYANAAHMTTTFTAPPRQ